MNQHFEEKWKFFHACKIDIGIVEKLIERSLLEHSTTKFISSLDLYTSSTDIGKKRFENLIIRMTESNPYQFSNCWRGQNDFKMLCSVQKEKYTNYMKTEKSMDGNKLKVNRLDDFWMSLLKEQDFESNSLEKVIKKVLIFPHINAEVKRGLTFD